MYAGSQQRTKPRSLLVGGTRKVLYNAATEQSSLRAGCLARVVRIRTRR